MYSLNVPLPGAVYRVLQSFKPVLGDDTRDDPTLVLKRLDTTSMDATVIEKRVRHTLQSTAPFDVDITAVDTFDSPTTGTGTVLYLAIDSPPLHRIHDRLCDIVDPDPAVEGPNYTPHITIGRTTDADRIDTVSARDITPVSWTVTTLEFYDASTDTIHGQIALTE